MDYKDLCFAHSLGNVPQIWGKTFRSQRNVTPFGGKTFRPRENVPWI